jgi:hypothetical protein
MTTTSDERERWKKREEEGKLLRIGDLGRRGKKAARAKWREAPKN